MTSPAADQNRGHLFRKYTLWLLAILAASVLAHRGFEAWSSYQEQRAMLTLMQRQQAEAAATKISQFIEDIESQMEWLLQLPSNASTPEQWHFDSVRLLRKVPAVTELARIDAKGSELVLVSRTSLDVVGGKANWAREFKFVQAMLSKRYHSPVYFRRDSEPYMTLAIAGPRDEDGVVAAEVNLKFLRHVVLEIKAALGRTIFVIDRTGQLIAHPDISLVLRNIDLSHLACVQSALQQSEVPTHEPAVHHDVYRQQAITTHVPIPSLGWTLMLCDPESAVHPGRTRTAFYPHHDTTMISRFP